MDRTTDGQGAISGFDRRSVAKLDAGSWKDPRFAGERVPLLDDVLAEFLGRAFLAVEMKEVLPDPILQAIGEAYRASLGAEVLLASFDAKALERARDIVPALPRAVILGAQTPMPPPELASYLGLAGLFAPEGRVDERFVVECRRSGLALTVYSVDDPGRAEALMAMGVEGIIVDDPGRMRPHLPPEST